MKCIKGYDIKIMKSNAGYYIGTRDGEGFPNCRISDYRETPGTISDYNLARMVYAMENQYCNGCRNCVTGEPFDDILTGAKI